jgi:DNA-binding transcriptional MocR family regulator
VTTHGRGGTRISLGPPLPVRGPVQVPSGVRNLADGNPDPNLLPDLSPALARLDGTPRLYGQAPNLPALVELAKRQFQDDGVPADALTVVGGAMEAFERVLGVHLERGDRIAIEDPGHANLIDLARVLGLQIEPVTIDAHGPIVEDVDRALRRGARALAITPRAQNPTGAALSTQRLADLAALARTFPDVVVIEDDHAGRVAGAPARTLASTGLDRWAVVRSVSKTLGPDLRLAVVSGDRMTIDRVEGRRLLGTGWVSNVLQELVVTLWSDPHTNRLLATAQQTYSERRRAVTDALRKRGITGQGVSGLNVWVPVAEEHGPERRLLDLGWAVSPGRRFRLTSPPALRITATALLPEEAEPFAADFERALSPDHRTRET